jgi:hypothetical protein
LFPFAGLFPDTVRYPWQRVRYSCARLKSESSRADKQTWQVIVDFHGRSETGPRWKLLLFCQTAFCIKPFRHTVKVLSQVCGAAREIFMRCRTARQLVGQLADLRHLARCSALRELAAECTMMQSPNEEIGRKAVCDKAVPDRVEMELFAGAAHEIHT